MIQGGCVIGVGMGMGRSTTPNIPLVIPPPLIGRSGSLSESSYAGSGRRWALDNVCLGDDDTVHEAQAYQQKLMQFLMGLNETYSAIRGQILLMNPFPSIRQAYYLVSQEEKKRLLSATQTATDIGRSAAMAVRHNNGGKMQFSTGADCPGVHSSQVSEVPHNNEGKPAFHYQKPNSSNFYDFLTITMRFLVKVNAVTKPGSGYEEDDWFG
ncbi:unnamed protein product [Fraxinus pennsylvanica]|uniref:Uncharacterized protein n=1 Tax=Fraxinus pennsylvanica TaxID=56036 RepID=A0AAD1ZTX8_9LAMI|nr:unnamed protein product [Fraxinus pennsylvanica]